MNENTPSLGLTEKRPVETLCADGNRYSADENNRNVPEKLCKGSASHRLGAPLIAALAANPTSGAHLSFTRQTSRSAFYLTRLPKVVRTQWHDSRQLLRFAEKRTGLNRWSRLMFRRVLMASAAAVVLTAPVAAENDKNTSNDGPIIEAIKNGKPLIDVRYRFEIKDMEGFAQTAYANTIRTRLGYESGEVHNIKFLIEFENVTTLGDDHFNSTTNGRTQFPVIADPSAVEINRAQVTFTGIDKTPITIGRQRYNLNNHRFVGAVDWRQNQQTFDAARITTKLIDHVTLDYAYISRVHRIFGDEHPVGEFDSKSHVISAVINGEELGTLKSYGVVLDLEQAPALSSQSWGARYENSVSLGKDNGAKLGVVAEFATQSEHAANPVAYRESYIHGEVSLGIASVNGKIGYEKLGGDGVSSFKTPLATLHKFQGFADVFLATPAAGLQDFYGSLSYSWKDAPMGTGVKLFAVYHSFQTDVGSLDFGDEFDAGLKVSFKKHWSAIIKGAVYNGGGFGPADRSVVWAGLRFRY